MKYTKPKYINGEILKNTIWVVRSADEWKWLQKKHKWMKDYPDYLESGFASHRWVIREGRLYSWIQIDPKKFKGYTYAYVSAVVAHECLHCVQRTVEWMGEDRTIEWEAYVLDWLVVEVLKAVMPKLFKKRVK